MSLCQKVNNLMATHTLSPREDQIVELCSHGFTNDGIAEQLGLSIGTVNTYWVRIKVKIGGAGRTDTVVRVLKAKAERLLAEANAERKLLERVIVENERQFLEYRTTVEKLRVELVHTKSAIWATDRDLEIHVIENGMPANSDCVLHLDVGKTIYEVFETKDPESPAVAAHLAALTGIESEVRLEGALREMFLHVVPLTDSVKHITGCFSILNSYRYMA